VKFDGVGNMYIANQVNNVIRKISASGIIATIAGSGVAGYMGDGGQATDSKLYIPDDVAFDADGNLYIADGGNAVIRKINTLGVITTFAGIIGGGFGGDGGPAIAAQLNDPFGIVFDNIGNLYFSDGGNYRVRKISTSGIITTVAGTGISGCSGDGVPATAAQFKIPGYLAISSTGEIYIPDWECRTVRKINNLGIISTVAGGGSETGDGIPATAALLNSPEAVVIDNSGNLYISSYTTCAIRKVSTSGIISTVVGDNTCGYSGDGGPATAAEINQEAICSYVDAGGDLYIADSKNNRIRKVTYPSTAIGNVTNTAQAISIYPNPAQNEITITAPDKIETITITNMIGQSVPTPVISMKERESILNVASLPGGVYFVSVNEVHVGKMVKE